MKVIQTNDMELNNELSVQLQQLLVASFPEIYPEERMYFKQVPHSRLLVMDAEHLLIGHVGLDYRTMNLNGTAIRVLGVDNTLTTVGIGDQVMDGLMMKQAGTVPWDEGELDFIGYLY
ncbi:hypothetical protein [Paenibacillus sp. MABNR03]|uniref:hypothetical protein n=1 Tax=Paenibacillus sp. MABNR03 TaxID=3142626 RepID=UPI003D295B6B